MVFNSVLPGSPDRLTAEARAKWRRYAALYKSFMRPVLATSRVYHHAPVNATGGVESGDWFALEFGTPDRRKGWATIVHLRRDAPGEYLLKPRGLDAGRAYAVTDDNSGHRQVLPGAALMRDGLAVQTRPERLSGLLLFEAV
jgi:hypothetical protein